jgi:hypothetical protein
VSTCNRLHTLNQQLCRWLLLSLLTGCPPTSWNMTQDLIDNMLGVRREGVTNCQRCLTPGGGLRFFWDPHLCGNFVSVLKQVDLPEVHDE